MRRMSLSSHPKHADCWCLHATWTAPVLFLLHHKSGYLCWLSCLFPSWWAMSPLPVLLYQQLFTMSGVQDSYRRDELSSVFMQQLAGGDFAMCWGCFQRYATVKTQCKLLETKPYVLATYVTFVSISVGIQSLVRLLFSSGKKADLKRVG